MHVVAILLINFKYIFVVINIMPQVILIKLSLYWTQKNSVVWYFFLSISPSRIMSRFEIVLHLILAPVGNCVLFPERERTADIIKNTIINEDQKCSLWKGWGWVGAWPTDCCGQTKIPNVIYHPHQLRHLSMTEHEWNFYTSCNLG